MCLTFTLWISNAGPFWHILATHKKVSQVKQKCPLLLEMRQTMHLWCKNESGTKNINENVSDVRGEIINSDHSTDIHIISLLSQLKTPATALNRIPPGFFLYQKGTRWKGSIIMSQITNICQVPFYSQSGAASPWGSKAQMIICKGIKCCSTHQSVNSWSLFHPQNMNKAFSSSTWDLKPLLWHKGHRNQLSFSWWGPVRQNARSQSQTARS